MIHILHCIHLHIFWQVSQSASHNARRVVQSQRLNGATRLQSQGAVDSTRFQSKGAVSVTRVQSRGANLNEDIHNLMGVDLYLGLN